MILRLQAARCCEVSPCVVVALVGAALGEPSAAVAERTSMSVAAEVGDAALGEPSAGTAAGHSPSRLFLLRGLRDDVWDDPITP